MRLTATILTFLLILTSCGKPQTEPASGTDFTVGEGTFLLDGEPFIVKAAELHYPRIPKEYWEHRIQMCKALGMNTICIYIFWNFHEQEEGVFDFTGQADVAEFCRLAQANGMYVIVRPGPYVCAEWEMGGLPWWILKKKDIALRERDPYFMERVRIFEEKVGEQLAPLTIQNGGPIIMVQVENEYGSYGADKQYVSEIRDILRDSGFSDVTLFQCDWASNFHLNALDDLVWTMNFGTGANIDQQFRRLGEMRPDAPKMCSEFWSGWFDKWGARHETRPAEDMTAGIDEMLSKGISFSLYMTHGGTSFGHWAGANSPGFAPDVTSYDYDAPINEYGEPTHKYNLLREVLAKYSDEPLPEIPQPAAERIVTPEVMLEEFVPIQAGISHRHTSETPLTFEEMDMGWGSAIYRTTLPEIGERSFITLSEAHDFAQIFIDGKYIGKIDRVKHERSLAIPVCREGAVLEVFIEAMGRINFGRAIKDFKGITDKVTVTSDAGTIDLKNWEICCIPDGYEDATRALEAVDTPQSYDKGAGYYRGTFRLRKTGDTFINMEAFGKGQVYVNGHSIGRFWNIGPQQTLYVPGCWLKKGKNEIIVLDVVGPSEEPVIFGQDTPEIDKLNLEEPRTHNNYRNRPDLKAAKPVKSGTFRSGNGWQKVTFQTTAADHIVLEVRSTHSGDAEAAIAELYLNGADGKRLSRESWTVKYADSEDILRGNHTADKVFDLQESTYWKTLPESALPHILVIDLGGKTDISGLEYLPRAEQGAPGSIQDYKIYLF